MSNTFSNELSPAETERLAMLAEECGEVVQIVGKILRHGYESKHPNGGPTNREQLERELGDVEAVKKMMIAGFDVRENEVIGHCGSKLTKVLQWLHHQKRLMGKMGIVVDSERT